MEKIIGTYSFFCDCGIAVVGIEYGIDDVVLYRYVNGERRGRLCRARVRDSASGRAYFQTRFGRVYFDEVMRTDI
jgi:hypothetical protein